jgi:hypothetical protein
MAIPDNATLQSYLLEILAALESSVGRLTGDIAAQRGTGIATSEIANRVIADTRTGSGWIRALAGTTRDIGERVQQNAYQSSQIESVQQGTDRPDPLMMWNAVLSNTCPDCVERHGIILPLSEWRARGLPGQGATVCRYHCRCTLLPADKAAKLYDTPAGNLGALTTRAQSVFTKKAAEIRRQEAERGKEYAESTFLAKLGNAREPGASAVPSGITSVLDITDQTAERAERFADNQLNRARRRGRL